MLSKLTSQLSQLEQKRHELLRGKTNLKHEILKIKIIKNAMC